MPSIPLSLDLLNWTDGCIALADSDIDELFSVVTIGTPVRIIP
jgi:lipoprotein-anchoring transpeptidase ErfK/SrfK